MIILKFSKYILLIVVLFIGLYSCDHSTSFIDDNSDYEDTLINEDTLNSKKVKTIFYNVPSPIEMANLMQKAGVEYRKEFLNPVSNKDRYVVIAEVALNLGVYGADLSYTRMFDQIPESINYLSSIRKLSDALGIPEEAGASTISKMEDNMNNRDSLLQIITDTYSSADRYLKENDRGNTATLIIIGGWVEALYLATQLSNDNKIIYERIAEQKYALNNLIELIKTYKDENLAKFLVKFEDLQQTFNTIEMTYTKSEVKTDMKTKTTLIESKSTIKINKAQITEITKKIEKIRKDIVN
jgi:hypothetical protein